LGNLPETPSGLMPDINRDNIANPGYALICVSGYLVR